MRVIVVPGTWGREQDWYRPRSPWGQYVTRLGLEVYEPAGYPFLWSTDINGWQFWRRWGIGSRYRDHWDWQAGGDALFSLIVPALAPERRIPPRETVIISHSHGLQVVLYACATRGLLVDRLIDVSGPVRGDLRDVTAAARANIRQWLHVYSDGTDRMQWFGEFGDGVLGKIRRHPLADVNWQLPKAGHSGVLHDPAWMAQFWPGAVNWLRQA